VGRRGALHGGGGDAGCLIGCPVFGIRSEWAVDVVVQVVLLARFGDPVRPVGTEARGRNSSQRFASGYCRL